MNREIRVRVAGIIMQEERLLLIAHKKEKDVYWLLPGGGVRYAESLPEALKREFHEELNVAIEVNELAFICDSIEPTCKRHILNICFYCTCDSEDFSLGQEARLYDFGFFTIDELDGLIVYPPITESLKMALTNSVDSLYLGSLWQ